jgi:hypothetical protein
MAIILSNNVASTLLSAIGTGDTSLVVASGDGVLFPSPTGGDHFYITVIETSGALEIMKVTSRSSDTLSLTRAQDGTAAASFTAGARIEMRVNAASVEDAVSEATANIVTGDGTTGGTGSAGAGNQYVEITVGGTTYRVLHDGTS